MFVHSFQQVSAKRWLPARLAAGTIWHSPADSEAAASIYTEEEMRYNFLSYTPELQERGEKKRTQPPDDLQEGWRPAASPPATGWRGISSERVRKAGQWDSCVL